MFSAERTKGRSACTVPRRSWQHFRRIGDVPKRAGDTSAARWGGLHEGDVKTAWHVIQLRTDRAWLHLRKQVCGEAPFIHSLFGILRHFQHIFRLWNALAKRLMLVRKYKKYYDLFITVMWVQVRNRAREKIDCNIKHDKPKLTRFGDRAFRVAGPSVWNSLPTDIRHPDWSL